MRFVSIDVGIRNLSFCFFDTNELTKEYKVLKWDNIDLTEQETFTCAGELGCIKQIKFVKNNQCYCLAHAKKQPFIKPSAELKISSLNKKKIADLSNLAIKYKLNVTPIMKKKEIMDLFVAFIEDKCFESVVTCNATKVSLVTIGRNIQHKMDNIFGEDVLTIDKIIIENQIGPLAGKMQTVQGMLSQYFIMKNNNIQIEFISATNKLKEFQTDNVKLDYKGRKKLGVEVCSKMIPEEWKSFFEKHKKKDDLSDCFLQGFYFSTFKKS